MTRLGALSVDLDGSRHYRAIHGEPRPHLVVARASSGQSFLPLAVRRATRFAERHAVPLTFFVVTEDLDDPALVESLRLARAAGHALESHSRSHRYDLVELPAARRYEEIGGSFDDLEQVFGVRPTGFRAPGFTLSSGLFDALERAGARFDASLLPSPPYAALKLAALAVHAMRGRRSASHPFAGAQLLGPRDVHRPGHDPGSRGARTFVELPMAVTRGARLPLVAALFATSLAGPLRRGTEDLELLSVGLHALDFVERDEADGVPSYEPTLRAPLSARAARLDALVRDGARTWVTLAAAAATLGPTLG